MTGQLTTPPYPQPPQLGPQRPPKPRRRWKPILLIGVPLALVGLPLATLGMWYALLWAMNPVGDEWQCSQGEVPADSGCYPQDEPLPPGVVADPLGNRPMPYNCDKRGWTLIKQDGRDREDCLNDRLPIPRGWHVAE